MFVKMNILICPASLDVYALWDIFWLAGVYTLMEIVFKEGAFSIKKIRAEI